jgi:hypothetical protein
MTSSEDWKSGPMNLTFAKIHYVLREPSEDCVLQYRLQQMVNHRPSTDDGKIMFDPESVAKAQRILVAGSLFQGISLYLQRLLRLGPTG